MRAPYATKGRTCSPVSFTLALPRTAAIFVHIRCCSESAPLEWHCSQGTQLDKRNGKPLCQGIRVINVLDPMGKHFYRTLWRRGTSQAARDYACGYVRHKSREEAILRLRAAGVGHATLYKDVANAFYSPLHDQLDLAAVAKTMRPQDQVLLKQRRKAACIHLQAADGPILPSVGSGALQGDSIASDLFMEQYHPLVDEWLQRAAQASTYHQMCAYDPVNCKYVNTASSVFADDLAIKVICDEAADLQAQASFLDEELDEVLASGGMAQNRDKQEIVSYFAGRGSHKQMREIYCGKTPLEGKAVPQAKYLGEICTRNGSTTAARKHRLDKAQAAWASMGSFWTRTGCSKRSVNMVFRALVFETAVAGLAPFVLSQSDYTPSMLLSRPKGGSSCGEARASAKNSRTVLSSMQLSPTNKSGGILGLQESTWNCVSNACNSGNVCYDNQNFTPMFSLLCSGSSRLKQPPRCKRMAPCLLQRIRGSNSWLMISKLCRTSPIWSISPTQWTGSRYAYSAMTLDWIFLWLTCPFSGASFSVWKSPHQDTRAPQCRENRLPKTCPTFQMVLCAVELSSRAKPWQYTAPSYMSIRRWKLCLWSQINACSAGRFLQMFFRRGDMWRIPSYSSIAVVGLVLSTGHQIFRTILTAACVTHSLRLLRPCAIIWGSIWAHNYSESVVESSLNVMDKWAANAGTPNGPALKRAQVGGEKDELVLKAVQLLMKSNLKLSADVRALQSALASSHLRPLS